MHRAEHGRAHDHELWESVALAALDRVQQRQARTIEQHRLSGDCQYFWSMEDTAITWSRDGHEFLRGRITMIASVNTGRGTWLWSWANDSLPRAVLGDIERVRSYGIEHNFPLLTAPGFRADQKPVAQARTVAADVLDAELLWRNVSDPDLEIHFAVRELRRS